MSSAKFYCTGITVSIVFHMLVRLVANGSIYYVIMGEQIYPTLPN